MHNMTAVSGCALIWVVILITMTRTIPVPCTMPGIVHTGSGAVSTTKQ
jgi:hypothetical protein